MKKLILTALAATVMFAFCAEAQTYKDLNKGSATAASQAKSGNATGAAVTAKKTTQNGSFSTTTTLGLRNAVNKAINEQKNSTPAKSQQSNVATKPTSSN